LVVALDKTRGWTLVRECDAKRAIRAPPLELFPIRKGPTIGVVVSMLEIGAGRSLLEPRSVSEVPAHLLPTQSAAKDDNALPTDLGNSPQTWAGYSSRGAVAKLKTFVNEPSGLRSAISNPLITP
jgi:hypothetical protein